MLTPARRGQTPTPSNHRLRHGLPGYLILFATHAFVPQRQLKPSRPPSPLVFLPISTHFTATPGIPPTSTSLKLNSFKRSPQVEPMVSRLTCLAAYAPFTPSKSGQRLLPTYYRGCWHVVSRSFLLGYRHYLHQEQWFTIRKPSSHTRRCCIRVSPIVQYPPTAASRRSLGRVSVPMWPFNLSVRLPIVALVGLYPTN